MASVSGQNLSQSVCLPACLSLTHTILGTGKRPRAIPVLDPVQLLTSCVTLSNPGSLGFSFCNVSSQVGGFENLLR